jgi:cytidine deaminase
MIGENKFDRLCNIAKKNITRCQYKYKLVAIVFDKKKILSIGINCHTKSYPFLTKYFRHSTLHAEIAALIPIMHREDNESLSMFVYREDKAGVIRNAKSCPMCTQTMYETGWFKNIYWTCDENKEIGYSNITSMYVDVMLMNKDKRFLLNGK